MDLVPGGGLGDDGQSWLPSREDFLVHVKPLSILFRAKFRDVLKNTEIFTLVRAETWQQEWVVHCQPVGNGAAALKYLAPYIFRVAISNKRILKLADGKVTFRYTESGTNKPRLCTLAAEEFIRRFLLHVLPKGFMKIRYYGFLAHANKKTCIPLLRQLIDPDAEVIEKLEETNDEMMMRLTGVDISLCKKCGKGKMVYMEARGNLEK